MPLVQYSGPYIDEKVQHIGITRLRMLNAANLRDLDKTLVIQDNDKSLAVLLSYENFLIMQKQLISVLETLDMFTNGDEPERVRKGLDERNTGQFRPFRQIQKDTKEKLEKK
jgi:hypothetical protein